MGKVDAALDGEELGTNDGDMDELGVKDGVDDGSAVGDITG